MELSVVYRCVAALDVHQAKLTVCILFENDQGEVVTQIREFGGFKRDRREMAGNRVAAPPIKKIPPTASCDFLIRRNDGRYIKMASAY